MLFLLVWSVLDKSFMCGRVSARTQQPFLTLFSKPLFHIHLINSQNLNTMELQTIFIKDTNNQYSIREDGEVIRHFSIVSSQHIDTKIVYRDKIVKQHLVIKKNRLPKVRVLLYLVDGTYLQKMTTALMLEHFQNMNTIEIKQYHIIHKDNDIFNCALSNINLKKKQPNRINTESAVTDKQSNIYARDNISKGYISNILGISSRELTDELHDLYKIQLKTKRLLSKKTNKSIHSYK